MKIRHVLSAFLLAHLVLACQSDDPTIDPTPTPTRPANPTYDFGGNAQLRPEVVVLPAEASDHVMMSETKLVFPRSGNEWLLSAPAGTPLVGGRRHSVFASNNALGFMRKIRSTSADASTITVETERATLPEIITGDFELATPDGVLTPISPVGLDLDALYFSDWVGIDPKDCDDNGVCVVSPDDGNGPPPFASSTPAAFHLFPPAPPALPVGSRIFPAAPSLSATSTENADADATFQAEMQAAGPEAFLSTLTDLVAATSKVREVKEKGIKSYSEVELKKLLAIAAKNIEEEGNLEAAQAMRDLSSVLLSPDFAALGTAAAKAEGPPGLQPLGLWDAVSNSFKKVVDVISKPFRALLSTDATLTLPTLGHKKEDPWEFKFIEIKDKEKTIGPTVLSLTANARLEAHAYLATKARIKGSMPSVNEIDFAAWLEGDLGAGAKVLADAEVAVKSKPTDEDAKALAKIPEKSKTPWQKRIVSLGPFAGPNLGPIPTTFRVNFDAKCDWELKAKINAELEAGVSASVKLGAQYKAGKWSGIGDFDWQKDFKAQLTLGGGAQVRCGVEPSVAWLIGDAVGPNITAFGGLKAGLSYEESCQDAKSTSPDSTIDLGLSAFVELGIGGKVQIFGVDLAEIGPLNIYENEWPLLSKQWQFPGGGFGYCSAGCGGFGSTCCNDTECSAGLTCDPAVGKCDCDSGIQCGDACCASGEVCVDNACTKQAVACAQFQQVPATVNNAGCDAKKTCPTSCKYASGPSGYYLIKPNASKPAFQVLCDKTLDGGGWTLVGFEPKGDPSPGTSTGIMAQLWQESAGVDPVALSKTTKAGFIGPRFSFPSNYSEARLTWCADAATMKYQRFTTSADLFANTLANKPNASTSGDPLSGPDQMLKLTNFSSNDTSLLALVKNPDDAGFCRAYAGSLIPGDTSWAVKQRAESSNACGCNSGGWQGTGSYYGGKGTSGNNDGCDPQGGGWAGTADNSVKKGGINTNEFYFWIR